MTPADNIYRGEGFILKRAGVILSFDAFGKFLISTMMVVGLASCGKIRTFKNESLHVSTTPKVIRVTSDKPNGVYKEGTLIPIAVEFSEEVTVQGTPQLELNVIPQTFVDFSNGSGTRSLIFQYKVGANDSVDSVLDYVSKDSLIPNGAEITSIYGIPANTELPEVDSGNSLTGSGFAKVIALDTSIPLAATSIKWNETSPWNKNEVNASWSKSVSTDVITQNLIVFKNGNCTAPFFTTKNLDSTKFNDLITGADGETYSFKIVVLDQAGNEAESSCSSDILIDMTSPEIAITSPTGNFWINTTSDSSTYSVSGNCNETNQVVSIQVDAITIGTAICTGSLFSGNIDSTKLSEGQHQLTAVISDAANNSSTSTSLNLTRDVTSPDIAKNLDWSQTSPFNSTSVFASWAKSGSSDLESQSIQFYEGSNCEGQAYGNPTSYAKTVQGADLIGVNGGIYSYKIISYDQAGNSTSSPCSSSMAIDTTPPSIAVTSPVSGTWINKNTDSTTYSVSGNCSEVNRTVTIYLDGINSGTTNCNGNTFTATINSKALIEADHFLSAQISDLAGNSTTSTLISFGRDVQSPQLTVGQMSINDGATSTGNNFVRVSLKATDVQNNVTKFCLKYANSTEPTSSASCWVSVNSPVVGLTPSMSLNLMNYDYAVGFVPNPYTVYAWVMDTAGNVSSLTASGAGTSGTDKTLITVEATQAPVITDVLATSSDSPSNPPTSSEITLQSGETVYIKWKVTDEKALPATPVTLFYTTDDTNFIQIATGLANGQNGSCSVNNPDTTADDQATGCYVWTNGSPTTSFYRIRVAVKDSDNITTFSTSAPLNAAGVFNFIAGNTDPGLGASAKAAVFFPAKSLNYYADVGSFVMARDGVIYHRDLSRGIIMVTPGDGNRQALLIPTTGTATDGPISSATLREPIKIALDYQDRLLIWDYNKIRRVNTDLNPMTVETIIGGGGTVADQTAPLHYQITSVGSINNNESKIPMFVPLPNGDLYFTNYSWQYPSSLGGKISHYDSVNNLIRHVVPTGIGANGYPTQNIADCYFTIGGVRFDPATSLVDRFMILLQDNNTTAASKCDLTGLATLNSSGSALANRIPNAPTESSYNYRVSARNGEVYTVNRWTGRVWKYNASSNAWDAVLGAGTGVGNCADGTDALSCKIDINDLFVDDQENIFFMDRGVIRIVEKSTNQVKTILGQNLSYGDGGSALSARFNQINNIDRAQSGEVVIIDANEYKLRSISSTGTVSTIAGNGMNAVPALNDIATSQPLIINSGWGALVDDFVMNPISGDIYFTTGSGIGRLNRSTSKWENLMGNGSTYYSLADNLLGNQIIGSSREAPKTIGFDGTNILVAIGGYTSQTVSNMQFGYLKKYRITDGLQTHLAADVNSATPTYSFCADGTPTATCVVPQTHGTPRYNRSTYDQFNSPARWVIMQPGTAELRSMEEGIGGMVGTIATFTDIATSFAYVHNATTHVAYYCSKFDYKIHKHDIATGTDAPLSWPISSMKCNGRSMVYYENSPTDRRLVFPYIQNALAGVAEYLNP